MREDRPSLSRNETPQSKLSAFKILPNLRLEPCEHVDAISSMQSDDSSCYWIDASASDTATLHSLIDQLDLSPFMRRHLQQTDQLETSQVLTLSTSALIVLRILSLDNDSKQARYAVAFCLKNILVTIAICPDNDEQARTAHMQMSRKVLTHMQTMELPQASTTGVLSVWLMSHVTRVTRTLAEIRKRIFEMQEKMETSIASLELSEISSVKDDLLRVLAVAEEQAQCVQSIADGDTVTCAIDFSTLQGSLGVLLSTSTSTERMAIRLEKRLAEIRQGYDAHQQDRINYRLSVLTIFSAVFLPITFMAGIWGMNFINMPSLERENGYYYALAAMAFVALVMLLFFCCFGWFK